MAATGQLTARKPDTAAKAQDASPAHRYRREGKYRLMVAPTSLDYSGRIRRSILRMRDLR